jgi:hypothetical protein
MRTFSTGKLSELRVARTEHKGRSLVDVRRWFLPKDTNEWRPTKKGASLSDAEIPGVLQAMREILTEAEAHLIDDHSIPVFSDSDDTTLTVSRYINYSTPGITIQRTFSNGYYTRLWMNDALAREAIEAIEDEADSK